MIEGLRRIANQNLLRYAVQLAICCKGCGNILDQARAVLVQGPGASWVGCGACWNRGPFVMDTERWSVLDGRILFATTTAARRARKRV